MIYSMTYTQKAPLFVHPVDKDGNPREVENLAFATSEPENGRTNLTAGDHDR